jgi:hypothetical protein
LERLSDATTVPDSSAGAKPDRYSSHHPASKIFPPPRLSRLNEYLSNSRLFGIFHVRYFMNLSEIVAFSRLENAQRGRLLKVFVSSVLQVVLAVADRCHGEEVNWRCLDS